MINLLYNVEVGLQARMKNSKVYRCTDRANYTYNSPLNSKSDADRKLKARKLLLHPLIISIQKAIRTPLNWFTSKETLDLVTRPRYQAYADTVAASSGYCVQADGCACAAFILGILFSPPTPSPPPIMQIYIICIEGQQKEKQNLYFNIHRPPRRSLYSGLYGAEPRSPEAVTALYSLRRISRSASAYSSPFYTTVCRSGSGRRRSSGRDVDVIPRCCRR